MALTNTTAPSGEPDVELCTILSRSQFAIIAKVMAYLTVFVFSAVGNIFVIVLILKAKQHRGPMDIFILNMAISDLFVPFIMIPRDIFEVISGSEEWQVSGLAGVILCKTIFYVSDISPLVSILTLLCITVERLLAVVRPRLPSYKEHRLHLVLAALTWAVPMGYFAPYFYAFKLHEENITSTSNNGTVLFCILNWGPAFDHVSTQQAFTTTTCILFIIIPFIMMACMYVLIFIKVRASHKLMASSLSQRAQKRRIVKMRTILKLSIVIVMGFAICWCPFNVAMFLLTVVWQWDFPRSCAFQTYWFIALFMSTVNAAINPWIYFIFVEKFKNELKHTSVLLLNVISKFRKGSELEDK